jgi:hypothetical protein
MVMELKKNSAKASEWLAKLVDNPRYFESESLYDLGKRDAGVSEPEAVMWLRVASERGHAGAQYELGILYKYGYIRNSEIGAFSLKQNKEKLLSWLRLSSASPVKSSEWNANYELGSLYDFGLVDMNSKPAGYLIKINHLEALKYYRWAATEGYKEAQNVLDKINKYEVNNWGDNYRERGNVIKLTK